VGLWRNSVGCNVTTHFHTIPSLIIAGDVRLIPNADSREGVEWPLWRSVFFKNAVRTAQ
jgi:hypothetical protein